MKEGDINDVSFFLNLLKKIQYTLNVGNTASFDKPIW
jgi:hypothetical protein